MCISAGLQDADAAVSLVGIGGSCSLCFFAEPTQWQAPSCFANGGTVKIMYHFKFWPWSCRFFVFNKVL